MKIGRLIILALLGSLFFSGCATQDPSTSQIPWSEPASWEGQLPGFGTPR